MSMLNFEINRAGRGLSAARRAVLNRAKVELRKAYGRGWMPQSPTSRQIRSTPR
jgi:hypothetical protein